MASVQGGPYDNNTAAAQYFDVLPKDVLNYLLRCSSLQPNSKFWYNHIPINMNAIDKVEGLLPYRPNLKRLFLLSSDNHTQMMTTQGGKLEMLSLDIHPPAAISIILLVFITKYGRKPANQCVI